MVAEGILFWMASKLWYFVLVISQVEVKVNMGLRMTVCVGRSLV